MDLSQIPRFVWNPADTTQKIALTWNIDESNSMIWKDGATYGSRSFIAFNRAKRVGVVVLSNTALSTGTDVDNAIYSAGVDILRYAALASEGDAQDQSQGPASADSAPGGAWRPDPRLID